MSAFYHETHNRASADYPYVQYYSKNLVYRPHFHRDVELAMVVEGQALVICDGKEILARTGDICVFMPGEIHSFAPSGENVIHILKVSCKHSVEKADLSSVRFQNPLSTENELGRTLCEAILDIEREDRLRSRGFAFAVCEQAARIVCALLRSDAQTVREAIEQKRHAVSLSMLERVNGYIEEHYTEQITLAGVAAAMGFSPYYFAHQFKEITGSTFYRHVLAYRCERAAELLEETEKKMIEIAGACGFFDVRSFNRAFKGVMGLTPSAYRERHGL